MNTSKLSSYAPAARKAFIAAVSAQAAKLGISAKGNAPAELQGDVMLVGGQAFPKAIASARKALVERAQSQGFEATMEAIAYTWFNRFVAIRYMELHGYLDHGYRVLSHSEAQGRPEILDHAADVDLPGLDRDRVVELKLDGTKDEELYRLLLKAQCNALHQAMPFLFEKIGDETELLLPANLLHTDSLIRQLVESIDEELWQDIEIIGWLYQFYISEKKDQVIGKMVKSEDIPAATQLFTPNWIVKYMVQNSLGAQWLATYPDSKLKGQMEYYIEPAEQTDEVKTQLAAITPSQLNPEELTLIDPASGSGHILVEAYELFKAIYLERGYRQRDIPQLILEKNLFGLDIDGRAAQLTGFALMMKGRADDQRLFERGVKLNVMALVDSAGFDAEGLAKGVELSDYGLKPGDLTELKRLFEHATTFGSLIQVPEELAKELPALKQLSEATSQELFVSDALKRLGPLVQQAELLAAQYDAVVANPPYMGRKYQAPILKAYLKDHYTGYEKDFFAAFIDRDLTFSKLSGRLGFVAPYVWMFISSFEQLRERLLRESSVSSLIQLEYNAFEPACIPVATFTLMRCHVPRFIGSYIKLSEFKGHQNQASRTLKAIRNRNCGWFFEAAQDELKKIPGVPMAYWVSDAVRSVFASEGALKDYAQFSCGMFTCNNVLFIRYWWEVAAQDTRMFGPQDGRWVSHVKGASGDSWSKPVNNVVDFSRDGDSIRDFRQSRGQSYCLPGEHYFFRTGVSFPLITSGMFSAVALDGRSTFDISSNSAFPTRVSYKILLAALCSKPTAVFVGVLCPTLNFTPGDVGKIPLLWDRLSRHESELEQIATECICRTNAVLQAFETSGDFQSFPILTASSEPTPTLESSYTAWITQNRATIAEMKRLEEENNRLFIDAYGLSEELTPDVPIEQITLTVNPAYRYGGKLTEEEQWTRFRQDTMEELVSYAIGCMMGRYSLNAQGLIYAHSSNEGFEPLKYKSFPADDDGIIPVMDMDWFPDDATNRFVDFIKVAWPEEHLEENLKFIADNLSAKHGESPRDTIRRYLSNSFFKDHLQTYKKRPIYWLFSSGKNGAFECLVYLHRYNESTLSRMRNEYVTPLQGKLTARVDYLISEKEKATSTSAKNKIQKQLDTLKKKRTELSTFDDELRHLADKRIKLDLDDGVKVNYGKFGNLLAEVKKVTGGKE